MSVQVQRWTIQRGRPTEQDKTGTGTATISGLDFDGDFDPTNAGGPYFGNLDPVKQVAIALQNPVTSTWTTLFQGFVADWNYELDVSEHYISFDIECVDALDILGDAELIPGVAGDLVVPVESTGDVFYAEQQVDDRIKDALRDAALSVGVEEWPADKMEIFTGNVLLQDTVYAPRMPVVNVLDDAVDAEFPGVSVRYVAKDGVVIFHGRLARFHPEDYDAGSLDPGQHPISTWKIGDLAAFALDDETAVISGLKFTRGKTNLINSALATPQGIKDADIAGQAVRDNTSIGTFGARSVSFENLVTKQGDEAGTPDANDETKKFATYYVDNYKDPRTRVSQIVFRPQATSGALGTAVWALMCGIELSDVVTLTTTHPGGGGFSAEDFFVEGISYEAVPMTATHPEVTLTLDVSPRAYYDTDPGFS